MLATRIAWLAVASLSFIACGGGPSADPPADSPDLASFTAPDLASAADLADPSVSDSPHPDLATGPTPDLAQPVESIPSFVAASPTVEITSMTTLSLVRPSSVVAQDLLLAFVDAEEGDDTRSLSAPAGWTLLGGYPIHNDAGAHSPYVIPATESHGTWIFWHIAGTSEPASYDLVFGSASHARGVMLAYRGADAVAPIHDKSGLGYYGTGGTNGLGSGNTTLDHGLEIQLVATARTAHPTYTVVGSSPNRHERVNSGEQPNGLNLVVYDEPILFGTYFGPQIANKQAPSGTSDGFCFSATSLVLKPL